MANRCKNTITVIGMKDAPESFAKALSKVMFGIDLDDMNPKMWGEDESVNGKTWYTILTDEYRREGVAVARYGILYPEEPYHRLGVIAPRYYVETKSDPPFDELRSASQVFPELTFHVAWGVLQDGPVGQIVVKDNQILEKIQREGSWYLFDWSILYPTVSLLRAHLPHTLAQLGTLRVEDTLDVLTELRRILDDHRFIKSPCHAHRDPQKLEQTRNKLGGLLEQVKDAAKELTFTGVFINDPSCQTIYDRKEQVPEGPVGNYQRRADEALAAKAEQK